MSDHKASVQLSSVKDWISNGISYIWCTALHEMHLLKDITDPVVSVIKPSEIVLLVVVDTVFPVHKHLLTSLCVCERKIHYDDVFKATLWDIEFDAMTLDVTEPYAFQLFFTYYIYGCRCTQCLAEYQVHHKQYQQILQYLSGELVEDREW